MILLPCPWCGPRNVSEFEYTGESRPRPDPSTVDQARWREYLYFRTNPRGPVREGWYHRAGCRQYFALHRDTATDEVLDPGGTP